MPKNCPKCDALMDHVEAEPDVNIEGLWSCTNCDHVEPDEGDDDDF